MRQMKRKSCLSCSVSRLKPYLHAAFSSHTSIFACVCVLLIVVVVFEFVLCVKWQQLTLDIFMLGPKAQRATYNAAFYPVKPQEQDI